MPKLKTNSSLKKRIKFTATGKIVCKYGYNGHNRRNRSKRALKQQMGTRLASVTETVMIKKMQYGSLV